MRLVLVLMILLGSASCAVVSPSPASEDPMLKVRETESHAPMTSTSRLETARVRIQEAARRQEQELGCRIGVSVHFPAANLRVERHGHDLFHAASTMKVPVMIEVFRQAEQGRFRMDDRVPVDPNFRSWIDDSPFTAPGDAYLQSRVGQQETILRLVEEMIDVSDNMATNILIKKVSPAKITGTMRSLGGVDGYVLRGVEDEVAFKAGFSNRISPCDLTALMEAIETDRAASPASCAEMRRILLAQQFRDMIPARLPEGVRVAHKTGSITANRHDTGIVYAPFGTYYVTLLADQLVDGNKGVLANAEVSRAIYDELEALAATAPSEK